MLKSTSGFNAALNIIFRFPSLPVLALLRDYEYDHKPDREKVMSDHADKLAEEDIDRGEAI